MTDNEDVPTDSIKLSEVAPGALVLPPVHEPRSRQWGLIAAIVIFALTLSGLTVWVIVSQQRTIEQQASRITEQNQAVSDLTKDLVASNQNAQDLYDQLLKLGQTPDGTNPASTTPVRGDQGLQGDQGLSGRDGKDGKDGTPGTPGLPGNNGKDGTPGADGQNGSNGQDGTPGAPGQPGANGKDGRGVSGVACAMTDSGPAFRFSFTDGTAQDVPGMCIVPTPTAN